METKVLWSAITVDLIDEINEYLKEGFALILMKYETSHGQTVYFAEMQRPRPRIVIKFGAVEKTS